MDKKLMLALEYVAAGWAVVPLNPGQKWLAADLAERLSFDWLDENRATADQVRRWLEIEPALNIGIRMAGSGLTVLDVDYPERLERCVSPSREIPNVPRVKTSRGVHYYFAAHDEDVCGQVWTASGSSGLAGDYLAPKDVPWRAGERAYVVAPPSIVDGVTYEWLFGPDKPLVQVPTWIRELVVKPVEPSSWYLDEQDYYDAEEELIDSMWDEYDPDWDLQDRLSEIEDLLASYGLVTTSDDHREVKALIKEAEEIRAQLSEDDEQSAADQAVAKLITERFPPGSDGPTGDDVARAYEDYYWGLTVDASQIAPLDIEDIVLIPGDDEDSGG